MQFFNKDIGPSEVKKFQCEIHPECQLEVLNFSKVNSQKSRFLCIKCMISFYEQSKGQSGSVIHLQDLLNDPNQIILKHLQNPNNQGLNGAQNVLEQMDKELTQYENMIKSQLLNMRQKVQQVKLACSQASQEILNYLKISDFVKQIQIVRDLDTHQGTKEFQQLEELSNFIGANIDQSQQHIHQKILGSQISIIQNLNALIKKLSQDSDKYFRAQIENIKQLLKDYVPPDICVELKGFTQINELISDGNACDGKSDLLTIFVSQNGNIFGGYSPCYVFKSYNSHLQDKTLRSFLFLYNQRQIFELKQQNAKLAIFCNSSRGPTFGHYDLEIESDFNKGSSNLGQCYDVSNYNIADPKTHLFGDIKPQIKECKVYKVIFK